MLAEDAAPDTGNDESSAVVEVIPAEIATEETGPIIEPVGTTVELQIDTTAEDDQILEPILPV